MGLTKKAGYVAGMIHKHGLKGLFIKVMETKHEMIDREYGKNWKNYMVTGEEWKVQRNTLFEHMPLMSVVVPLYRTPERFLRELLDGMKEQSYENWELCLADGSPDDTIGHFVEANYKDDARIRYQKLAENGGISENTNATIAMAAGEYIGFLDHDDVLAPNALYEMVRMLNAHPEAQMIYSDEDKIDAESGIHSRPHFKLDYNPELLMHYNYICHFLIIKRTLLDKTGRLDAAFDGAQDYDLVLRLSEQTDAIYHVHKILYHWRIHSGSTAGSSLSKDYAYEAGKRALEAAVKRRGIAAEVKEAQGRNYYDVIYRQDVPELELIDFCSVQDSQALDERIRNSQREYIFCYDSRHTKLISERERRELAQYILVDKTGLAGIRFRKRRKVVSAGIGMQPDGKYGYLFEKLPVCYKGYFERAVLPQNVYAVPLEQCIIKKEAYLIAGGIRLEKEPLERAVDFAARLHKAGYQIMLDAKITAVNKE